MILASPTMALLGLLSLAAADADPNFRSPSEETALDTGPVSIAVGHTVLSPAWLTTEATDFGAGIETLTILHPAPVDSNTVSWMRVGGLTDFAGRWRLGGQADLHWGGNRWHARLEAGYDGLRASLYGVGNPSPLLDPEFYEPRDLRLRALLARRVVRQMRAGVAVEAHRHTVHAAQAGGLLVPGGALEGQDGLVAGVGLVLEYDTRDAVFAPTAGTRARLVAAGYPRALGSEHGFTEYQADVRAYRSVAAAHVLAVQVNAGIVRGDAPFWRLLAAGERPYSRAYEADRVRDRMLAAAQGEWRWRWTDTLGWEVFAGLATLATDPAVLRLRDALPTVGGGLRISREVDGRRIPFRVTGAWGRDGWMLVVGTGDAF